MRKLFFVFATFILLGWGSAQAGPFDKGDAKKGQALAAKHCNACHVSLFGGDGSSVYTRAERKVKTAAQLASRISQCNTNTGAGWFPEDELNVGSHLNQRYYHFK